MADERDLKGGRGSIFPIPIVFIRPRVEDEERVKHIMFSSLDRAFVLNVLVLGMIP